MTSAVLRPSVGFRTPLGRGTWWRPVHRECTGRPSYGNVRTSPRFRIVRLGIAKMATSPLAIKRINSNRLGRRHDPKDDADDWLLVAEGKQGPFTNPMQAMATLSRMHSMGASWGGPPGAHPAGRMDGFAEGVVFEPFQRLWPRKPFGGLRQNLLSENGSRWQVPF